MPKKVEDRYVKLSHKEHILTRPETYIGSIEKEIKSIFVAKDYQEDIRNTKMEYKEVSYSPGFIKLFDEIITNASDHAIRTNKVSYIKVVIDNGTISIENDGPGIPVVIHDKEKIYVPELIFGHLLTGENYDDSEERFLGGRNGYGAKLTNIFSKEFIIETADGNKTYRQKFSKNMSSMTKPYTRKSKKSFTKITYTPDYDKFSMDGIDEITESILIKRVFDIAAYNPSLRVLLNGRIIPVRSFRDYMKLFTKEESEIYYEKINDNWEIGISESPSDSYTHVSMVNGISTILGGTHTNYISNIVINNVKDLLTRGVKGVNIRPNDVKNRILLFVNCKLPNPTFDNQTKENLTLRLNSLTKDVNINDNLLRRLSKSDIFSDLIELSLMKEKLEAQKELNKQVNKRIRIDKLFDANNAGKVKKSDSCHLFLTEGDCIYEETPVCVLRNNEKLDIKLKDVKLDDIVITHNSNFRLITNISKKIAKSVKIKLKNKNILICSREHKWYVYDKEINKFHFVKTKNIDTTKHKMIINKNVNFCNFIKINKITKIKDKKFNYLIHIDGDDILSTSGHQFNVLNIEDFSMNMVECDKLDKDIHFIVNYDKL